MVVIRKSKTLYFNFDFCKFVDKNLKDEPEFIISHNYSLAEYNITKEIDQLLLKYKHANDIHKHGK